MDLSVIGSSFTIKLCENGAIRSIYDRYPSCGVRIEVCTCCTEFIFSGLSLCKRDLESIITYIDKTLKNEIVGIHHLKFADPHIAGGPLYSPLSFTINGFENHEEDYWEFNYGNLDDRHGSGGDYYSICLNCQDIANLRTELISEMKKIDWENHGKTWFYQIDLPESDYENCIPVAEFEKKLDFFCRSFHLRKIFIPVVSYMSQHEYKKNAFSFFDGSQILLLFDEFLLDLHVYYDGFYKYGIHEGFDFGEYKPSFEWYPEEERESCFCDIKKMFSIPYEDATIKSCLVKRTEYASFGFDDNSDKSFFERAESVVFALDNSHTIEIYGDDSGFLGIIMK